MPSLLLLLFLCFTGLIQSATIPITDGVEIQGTVDDGNLYSVTSLPGFFLELELVSLTGTQISAAIKTVLSGSVSTVSPVGEYFFFRQYICSSEVTTTQEQYIISILGLSGANFTLTVWQRDGDLSDHQPKSVTLIGPTVVFFFFRVQDQDKRPSLIHITSPDDNLATVTNTPDVCPDFDPISISLPPGQYSTFSRQTTITLSKWYPPTIDSLVIVGISLNDDSIKTIEIRYELGKPYDEYTAAIVIPVIIYPAFMFLLLLSVGCFVRSLQKERTFFDLPPKITPINVNRDYTVLILVSELFFVIPSIMFTFSDLSAFYAGEYDSCYFNERCLRPLYFPAFNNIYSNIGYIICGISLLIYVKILQTRRYVMVACRDYSLPNSLAWCIVAIGINSSVYHVCPSLLRYQVDTGFMFMLFGLSTVEFWRKHFVVAPRAALYFFAFAVVIVMNYAGTFGPRAYVTPFKIFLILVVIFGWFFVGIRLFYLHEIPWDSLFRFRFWRLRRGRVALLLVVLPLYFIVIFLQVDNSDSILFTSAVTFLCVMITYALHNARKHRLLGTGNLKIKLSIFWAFMVFFIFGSWFAAFAFFLRGSYSTRVEPDQSRNVSNPCRLGDMYDNHDMWHFLGASALTFQTLILCHFEAFEEGKDSRIRSSNKGGLATILEGMETEIPTIREKTLSNLFDYEDFYEWFESLGSPSKITVPNYLTELPGEEKSKDE